MRIYRGRDPARNYLNRAMIGLGVGLVKARNGILNSDFGPQGTVDVLSTWIGQELAKEMLVQKKIGPNSSKKAIIVKLLDEMGVGEDVTLVLESSMAHLTVQNCLICPRRSGGYDLEGQTACPVGGLIRGAINLVTGRSPQVSRVRLKPPEICNIEFDLG